MEAADEQHLITLAKERDPSAFRVLVERYMKHAYNIAYGILRNHSDAEDVAQEAFVRVHRSLESFRGESEFNTWLYRITTNLALDRSKQLKSRAKYEVKQIDSMMVFSQAQQNSDHSDVVMHVERALHELPTLQRAVVLLRHINGLSTKSVSDILQCSEGTVKTHLHRGLKKMRTRLQFLKDESK
jgi:RNA polymerase sigma-70 factor (ECF subfamily)